MPVYHLDIEVEYDYELIGLSSHEKDYRLAWSINRHMDWSLKRIDDLLVERSKDQAAYARFEYVMPYYQTRFTLLDNKTEKGVLMPELAQFDFLIKVDNAPTPLDDTFYKKLKRTPLLIAAFPLITAKLKNKHLLLEEGSKNK